MTQTRRSDNDPGQPLRILTKDETLDDTRADYTGLSKTVQHAIAEINRMDDQDTRIFRTLRTFLLYSFVAETELMPSETILIKRTQANGDITFAYDRKNPINMTLTGMLTDQDRKIADLTRQVQELQNEIERLRQR